MTPDQTGSNCICWDVDPHPEFWKVSWEKIWVHSVFIPFWFPVVGPPDRVTRRWRIARSWRFPAIGCRSRYLGVPCGAVRCRWRWGSCECRRGAKGWDWVDDWAINGWIYYWLRTWWLRLNLMIESWLNHDGLIKNHFKHGDFTIRLNLMNPWNRIGWIKPDFVAMKNDGAVCHYINMMMIGGLTWYSMMGKMERSFHWQKLEWYLRKNVKLGGFNMKMMRFNHD